VLAGFLAGPPLEDDAVNDEARNIFIAVVERLVVPGARRLEMDADEVCAWLRELLVASTAA
jgi:hypothetical protein